MTALNLKVDHGYLARGTLKKQALTRAYKEFFHSSHHSPYLLINLIGMKSTKENAELVAKTEMSPSSTYQKTTRQYLYLHERTYASTSVNHYRGY